MTSTHPQLILLRGPAGVGKTTIANGLADQIGGIVISLDDVLREHGLDQVGPDERCIPAANFLQAQTEILGDTRRHLDSGRTVIIEGNFYHAEQPTHLQETLRSKPRIITLTAPLTTCLTRDAKRTKPLGEPSIRAVYQLVNELTIGEPLATGGKTIAQIITDLRQLISRREAL